MTLVIFVSLGRVELLTCTRHRSWHGLHWAGQGGKQSCFQALLSCQTTTSHGTNPALTLLPCKKAILPYPRATMSLHEVSPGRAGYVVVFGQRMFWAHSCNGRGGERRAPRGQGMGSSCEAQVWAWGAVPEEQRRAGLPAALAEVRAGGHGSLEFSWRRERGPN